MSIRVLFICHGNICRSTMAESVMTYLVKEAHLEDKIYVNSAATSREEIGNGPHRGTVAKLKQVGIPVVPHRAVQMTPDDYDNYDYLIGMDTENIRNMNRIAGGDRDEKIYKLLTFAGSGMDVADPWYTGDFEATYRDVLAGCKGLLESLKEEL
ncbi:MAG: low molecular weight protein-tyrosine-phosphatase [Lachnospira sp.]